MKKSLEESEKAGGREVNKKNVVQKVSCLVVAVFNRVADRAGGIR